MPSYYGYLRNSGVQKIAGYAQALERWDNTKPIRGRENQNMRPLGHRNRTYAIAKDEQTQDMVLYLWSEREAVRFKPDGDVVISAGDYISTSITNFFGDVFSYYQVRTYVYDHSVVVKLCNENAECRLAMGGSITIRKGDDGNYHFVGGNNTYHTALRRKEMKELREKVSGFMTYASGMCKLQEGVFEVDDTKEYISLAYWQLDTDAFAKGMTQTLQYMLNNDEDTKYKKWGEALYALANSYGKYIYNYHDRPKRKLTPQILKQSIDKILIGTHRDEVLERIPVTGSIKRDKYKDFYTSPKWVAYHASKEQA